MINDDNEPAEGRLVLSIEGQGAAPLAKRESRFRLTGLGRDVCEMDLPIPASPGKYLLKATAYPAGTRHKSPTVSQRKVSVDRFARIGI